MKPENQDYEMNIDRLGTNGEGVGRVDGFTVFVKGALAGERVLVKVVKVARTYAYGKLLHIIQKSPLRIEPRCPYFKSCGGCQLQHLTYDAQLDYKTEKVRDALERIGHLRDVTVHPAIGMDEPWNYRNKAQFPVGLVKGRPALGFYAARSHDLINIEQCPIQHEVINRVVGLMRKFFGML